MKTLSSLVTMSAMTVSALAMATRSRLQSLRTSTSTLFLLTLLSVVLLLVNVGFMSWLEKIRMILPKKKSASSHSDLSGAEEGSTNALVNVYNFHVAAVRDYFGQENVHFMKDADKEIRDVFVKATSIDQLANRRDLVAYAMDDAFYTSELFQALWPKYKAATPSKVGIAGHYFLNGSRIPVAPSWEKWIGHVEKVFHKHNQEVSDILRALIDKYVEPWTKKLEDDIAIAEAAWEEGEFDELELDYGKRKTITVDMALKAMDRECIDWRHESDAWLKNDPLAVSAGLDACCLSWQKQKLAKVGCWFH